MSKDSNNWRDDIWLRYGTLFDRDTPSRTGIANLPDGWRETIVALLERIETIARADKLGRLSITRLHCRFGMLDLDYALSGFRLREIVADVVDHAKARAACACDVCGATGCRYLDVRDVTVRCDTHRLPGSTEIIPPWPLIRIEREISDGASRITRCRIYDRDRDMFVDRKPTDLGISDVP